MQDVLASLQRKACLYRQFGKRVKYSTKRRGRHIINDTILMQPNGNTPLKGEKTAADSFVADGYTLLADLVKKEASVYPSA